jgi:DNA-binding MarR family transcriptional regulator
VSTRDEPHDGAPHLSYVVARLERAVRREINERVRPHGLTTAQFTTLSILGRGRALSNAQLARRAYMTPQSMSETIEALEAGGLITRRASPDHRRVLPATLTAKGRRVLAACEVEVSEMEEGMLAGLDAAERRSLLDGLLTAVRALHAGFPAD